MHTLSIDPKRRVFISKYYRSKLGLSKGSYVILTVDKKNRILLFPENTFNEDVLAFLEEEIGKIEKEELFYIKKYAHASKMDDRGRLILPVNLLEKNSVNQSFLFARINQKESAKWLVLSVDEEGL